MGGFKKPGGFNRGNPRTQRAEPRLGKSLAGLRFVRQSQSSWTKREQSSYDENQGQGFNRRGPSDRPRFGGGSGGFSRSENTGSRDGSRPQMFSAVCSECNRACEVPFRPTGDRPVFCRDCFGGKRGTSRAATPERDFPRRDFTPSAPSSKPPVEDKRIDDLKRQLDTVNKKLDAMMEMMKVVPAQKVKATREPEERSSRRMTAKRPVKVKK